MPVPGPAIVDRAKATAYFRRRSQTSAATEPITASAEKPARASISGTATGKGVTEAEAVPAHNAVKAETANFFITDTPLQIVCRIVRSWRTEAVTAVYFRRRSQTSAAMEPTTANADRPASASISGTAMATAPA